MKNFKITHGKGFHLLFKNGYKVSVQFGPGNYCENLKQNYFDFLEQMTNPEFFWESSDAECAVIDPQGNFVPLEKFDESLCDEVNGYMTSDEVLDLMNWAAKL